MIEQQTIEHLFFYCSCVKNIWMCVINKWNNLSGQNIALTLRLCILGMYDTSGVTENMSINILLLLVKQYIFVCKYDETVPNIIGFEIFFKNKIQLYSDSYDNCHYIQLETLF